MATPNIDWTHKEVKITDIRKLYKLYVISIESTNGEECELIDQPLFVKASIFDDRLKAYFLKDAFRVSREEIMSVDWNMYITKGFYIKVDENGIVNKFENDPNKLFVSYLEIGGALGSFCSIYREKE